MLKTHEITDLVSKPITPVVVGKVRFLAARENRNFATSTPAQRGFLDNLANQPLPASTAVEYQHPAAPPLPRRPADTPLSASELAWLQRLPADPTQVPHDDARTLASMATSLSPLTNTADHRLVTSIWDPVREFHDGNVARLQVQAANQPPPPIPPSALNALADAVAAENTQLAPHEAIGRASEMLSAAAATRNAAHQQRISDAATRAAAIAESARQRTAVTK